MERCSGRFQYFFFSLGLSTLNSRERLSVALVRARVRFQSIFLLAFSFVRTNKQHLKNTKNQFRMSPKQVSATQELFKRRRSGVLPRSYGDLRSRQTGHLDDLQGWDADRNRCFARNQRQTEIARAISTKRIYENSKRRTNQTDEISKNTPIQTRITRSTTEKKKAISTARKQKYHQNCANRATHSSSTFLHRHVHSLRSHRGCHYCRSFLHQQHNTAPENKHQQTIQLQS